MIRPAAIDRYWRKTERRFKTSLRSAQSELRQEKSPYSNWKIAQQFGLE
jgi:hypothetical protein